MSCFITFEGPEGSGKTTVIEHIKNVLSETHDIVKTREPGGIPISEKIREVLLDKEHSMDGRTEALLFAASRRQHLVERVIPALDAGKIVLCDRFIDSSLAYQGIARGIGFDDIMAINKFAIDTYMPDLTIYLKLDPAEGLQRIKDNQRENNRLDEETIDFHKKVVLGYNKLSELYPNRIKVVDAAQPIDKVVSDAANIINNYIQSRGEE
ncbi:Thymidylate kinase [Jeotgalicoccus aerolatus]|jgi:dTMP kinase|uniref:Thymidylate kinase n=1 Tax=Jeotgalicoccus aerolatus TaxID=709510 RepID=A0A1G9B8G6_9STAP|nr:dTMP kinase [Jeotgalicoccus aerolatus]MBP1951963.1 dTMP kinase [Jeotgalicoccus aerolatus]NMA81556.1 dTMP kinase [Jeotgalicoccus aerolatus]CAD2071435.1 Thymidylate kinase [Jeotgalicoccus aerolatus]SDK35763.1 dTMP kinase [Jeotgalicoccus aerolatus]GGE04755.1 thymidylate kinase [Jeotgalicoccus aerolatus]